MIDAHTYGLFFIAALVLVVTPGPDTLLVLSRTLADGTGHGLWTLLGTQTGNLVHAMLAGLGISTAILLFPVAFTVLRFGGAAYLVLLAIQAWRARPHMPAAPDAAKHRPASAGGFYVQGLANNLVNPKVIPFFLALFPQFIRPGAGNLPLQSAILGGTIVAISLVWIGGLAIVAGRARDLATHSAAYVRIMQRVAAVAFLALAARLVVVDH